MKKIGMIDEPVKEAETKEAPATKAEMIEAAEAAGIELTAAECRQNKEDLAKTIAEKAVEANEEL